MTLHEMVQGLKNNDGLTLKKGQAVTYKTGYQVATEGKEATTPTEAIKIIEEYNGNCGVWLSDGIYYVDKSHREPTKEKALEIGKACNQISILKWADMSLIYCWKAVFFFQKTSWQIAWKIL